MQQIHRHFEKRPNGRRVCSTPVKQKNEADDNQRRKMAGGDNCRTSAAVAAEPASVYTGIAPAESRHEARIWKQKHKSVRDGGVSDINGGASEDKGGGKKGG